LNHLGALALEAGAIEQRQQPGVMGIEAKRHVTPSKRRSPSGIPKISILSAGAAYR